MKYNISIDIGEDEISSKENDLLCSTIWRFFEENCIDIKHINISGTKILENEIAELYDSLDALAAGKITWEQRNNDLGDRLERIKALQKEVDCGIEMINGYASDPDTCCGCDAWSGDDPCWWLRLKEALK